MFGTCLQVDWPLEPLWNSPEGFIILMCITIGGIAVAAGRSMTVASFSAYILFLYYATNLENQLLTSIAYVSLTLICVGLGFKILRTEGWGE